jgi:hypothetical protein
VQISCTASSNDERFLLLASRLHAWPARGSGQRGGRHGLPTAFARSVQLVAPSSPLDSGTQRALPDDIDPVSESRGRRTLRLRRGSGADSIVRLAQAAFKAIGIP